MMELRFRNDIHAPVKLESGKVAVGRDPQNDIVLDVDGVSGFHAEIVEDQGQFFLVDLDSTNGTYVDGKKVFGRVALRAWQKVSFDEVEAELVDPSGRRPTMVRAAVTGDAAGGGAAATSGSSGPLVLRFKKEEHVDVTLDRPKISIGRDPGNDVVLDFDGVSGFHAQVTEDQGRYYLVDLGSTNGTQLEGKPISGKVELRAWQVLAFDEIEVELIDSSGRRPTVARRAVDTGETTTHGAKSTKVMDVVFESLKIVKGPGEGQSHALKGERMTIGRTEDNDIVLDSETVSSLHATLLREENGWVLIDEGATNGTFVNRKRVERRTLSDGNTVSLGDVDLLFSQVLSGRSGTVVIDAPSGVDPTVKRVSTVNGEERPTARPTRKSSSRRSRAALIYSVAGFTIALVALVLYTSMSGPRAQNLPLQASALWTQTQQGTKYRTTAALADINGDKVLDILLGNSNGTLLALDGEKGKLIFSGQVANEITAPPVTGDLNGDGKPEIIVGNVTGQVVAFTESDGEGQILWQSSYDLDLGAIINRPALVDLNSDRTVDIVVPTQKKGLVALNGKNGWMLWETGDLFGEPVVSAPLVSDLNGDGIVDIVGVTEAGLVVAISAQQKKVWSLWSTSVGASGCNSAALLKRKGTTAVVVASDIGVHAIDAVSGRTLWHVVLRDPFSACPLGVEVTGDGQNDVVVISKKGKLYVLDGGTGDVFSSRELNIGQTSTPALYDFNDDGVADLVLLDDKGNLRVVDLNRNRDLLTPALTPVPGADKFVASPVLADLSGDGFLEVLCPSLNGRIVAMQFNRKVGRHRAIWPVFLGNDTHSQ